MSNKRSKLALVLALCAAFAAAPLTIDAQGAPGAAPPAAKEAGGEVDKRVAAETARLEKRIDEIRALIAAEKSATTSYAKLSLMGNPVGGAKAASATLADGRTASDSLTLVRIVRELQGQRDVFEVRQNALFLMSKDGKRREKIEMYADANVKRYSEQIEEGGKLRWLEASLGSVQSGEIDVPEDADHAELVFAALIAASKASEKEEKKTFGSFDASMRIYRQNTITVSGKKYVEINGVKHEGFSVSFKSPQGTMSGVVDEKGNPILLEGMGMRMTHSEAFDLEKVAEASTGSISSEIKVTTRVPKPLNLETLTIRLTVPKDDPKEEAIITSNRYHDVTRNGTVYEATLKALRQKPGATVAAFPPVVPAAEQDFLKPTPESQSDDPGIIAKAKEITAGAVDARDAATKITKWVHGAVKKESGARGAATAIEVLKSCEGDCTEHSVLTVALLRAAGIPARNVTGVVYVVQGEQVLAGYHAWSEAWVGEWIGIDATIPETGLSARYLFLGYNEPGHDGGEGKLLRMIQGSTLEILSYKHFLGRVTEIPGAKQPEKAPGSDKPADEKPAENKPVENKTEGAR